MEQEFISSSAFLFRAKLLEEFPSLSAYLEKGHGEKITKISHNELHDAVSDGTAFKEGNRLVNFQSFFPHMASDSKESISSSMFKMSGLPHLREWSIWVTYSSVFQNIMVAAVFTNAVSIGIQSELEENTNAKVQWFCEILNGFDCICLSLFFIEIILKWLEGFRTFWKNGWNIFDFLVTFTTFIPEIILLVLQNKKYSSVQKLVEVMQVFRVVRALKIVMHVEQVRLIALAITKAFKEMTFIAMMLLTVMYIYAIVGVVMFGKYSNINVEKVDSEENFKNLSQAAATLFQLFTLDHWLKVFSDIYSLIGTWFSIIYIISWILIGSFIFRNIFVGILVNNFQSIRTELVQEVEQCLVKSSLADECQTEVEELVTKSGLYNPTSSHTKFQKDKQADDETRRESVYYDFSEEELSIDEEEYEDAMEDQSDQKNTEEKPQLISSRAGTPELNQLWNEMIHLKLESLESNPQETLWPEDTLFCYLQLLESLCENLEERKQLLELSATALLEIADSISTEYK